MNSPIERLTKKEERSGFLMATLDEDELYAVQNFIAGMKATKEYVKMQEKEKITNIYATIYCEKASHKGIIIGKHGEMLKKIGTMARGDIEKMLDKKVYLELWVKVKSDWRNSDFLIKNFGFTNE